MNFNLISGLAFFCIALPAVIASTNPILTSWILANGTLGYNDQAAYVTKVVYTTKKVYVASGDIPGYTIGPWNNPNVATTQSLNLSFPLNPTENTGTKTTTSMGKNGLWIDGTGLYNALDGMSYNSLGIWNKNAYYWESGTFDKCNGHAQLTGEYHIHCNPICLYDSTASTAHSPIIGFAYDGFPIYGPFGYTSANDTSSAIKRLLSSYSKRSITARTTLSNGTVLSTSQQGPAINSTYPLGSYIEDYEYVSGSGDLNQYNGRWGKTPEYPTGTFAYFVSTNSSGSPTYPYIIGPSYYGVV